MADEEVPVVDETDTAAEEVPVPEPPEPPVPITYTVENTGFTLTGLIGRHDQVPVVTVDGVEASADKQA